MKLIGPPFLKPGTMFASLQSTGTSPDSQMTEKQLRGISL